MQLGIFLNQLKLELEPLGVEITPAADLDLDLNITGFNTLDDSSLTELSFLSNKKYASELSNTKACAVFCTSEYSEIISHKSIITDAPYLVFAIGLQILSKSSESSESKSNIPNIFPEEGEHIHLSAILDPSVKLGKNISIGPNVVIESGVIIEDGVKIGANVYIGHNVLIGKNSIFYPNITIYYGVKIGKNCIFHSGCIIGSDGFGFAPHKGKFYKIPQIGSVEIHNNVEIGANTTIDRGALKNTIISEGVKIDNGVQIAHNVSIGPHTVIAAQTGIAGSTKIGSNCMIGGACAIGGHIQICNQVLLAGASTVAQSISKPGEYGSAILAQEKRKWQRNLMRFMRLDEIAVKIKRLDKLAQSLEPYFNSNNLNNLNNLNLSNKSRTEKIGVQQRWLMKCVKWIFSRS